MVLLPALEDVVVNNQRRTSSTDSVAFYSGSYHRYAGSLSGVRNTKGTSVTIGDVVFIADGKPFITFNQVADPHGLARVVRSKKATNPYASSWTSSNRIYKRRTP